jgi:glycosyltransferase involved in cell wall biosynthesis
MTKQTIHVMQLISSLQVGGAEKLLLDLLDETQPNGLVTFTVVVMNQAVNPELKARLERLHCEVYFLDRPEGHLHGKYLQKLLRIISDHDVDIVHSHNTGSKWWAILCKLCRPSLKLIFTVHDTAPIRQNAFHGFLQRIFINHYIAVSQSVERLCLEKGFVPVTQIYNGIDLQAYQNIRRNSLVKRLKAAPFQSRPLRIVQIGRLYHPKKGQDILISAIAQCKQKGMSVHATFMGGVYSYSQDSYDTLKKMVVDLDLQAEIDFVVNQTNVSAVLSEADLFVLPSRYEGLGLVVLEAMAAGVPVIVSNIDGPAELVCHGQNGLLFQSDVVASLFLAICTMYDHPELADLMAENALAFVKKFDIEGMRQQYHNLYQHALLEKSLPIGSVLREVSHGTFF